MNVAVRKKPDGETVKRRGIFRPATIDRDEMTVEAVVATETPVERWYGREVLRISRDAINRSRIDQVPLLDSHNRTSIAAILGAVSGWRVDGREVVCTLHFADTEQGRAAIELIAQGMIRTVSVGYAYGAEDFQDSRQDDGTTLRTVTRWMPFEVSLVSVPADHNAKIRGRPNMDPEEETIEVNPPSSERRANSGSVVRQINEIRTRAISAGVAAADLDAALDNSNTVEEARAAAFDLLAANSGRTVTTPARERAAPDHSEIRERTIEAFAHRLGVPAREGSQNPLLGRSMIEIARGFLDGVGGLPRGVSDDQIAGALAGSSRAAELFSYRSGHTVSDFPNLLEEAGNRALMARFSARQSPLKLLSALRNARDFRPQSFIRPGEAPKLEKVLENGEIKHGTLAEEKNGLTIDTYAKIFGLSRKALINDDLGAFSDFLQAFAEASVETEGDLFYALLSANAFGGAKLSDNKALFHADHGNLAAAGSAITVESLSAGREAMRLQKNVNGTGNAGATPSVIVVGPKLETQAEKVVAEITAATVNDVNPFSGKLKVAVENRYGGNGFWLFANPADRPAFVHAYLDGSEGPMVETRDGWNILGREFRCILDFGCAAYDHRAAYFNPGT